MSLSKTSSLSAGHRAVIPGLAGLCFAASVLLCSSAVAEVRLAKIFMDHMVLQRQKPVRVWGWADKGADVAVEFAGQSKKVKADDNGRWLAPLDPMEASSESRELVVKCQTDSVTLKDVLVGEVWVTPGQSNMESMLHYEENGDIEAPAARYPAIRFFRPVMRSGGWSPTDDFSPTPLDDFMDPTGKQNGGQLVPDNQWVVCSPQTVTQFSAVPYYFARVIHGNLNVPVGIINPSLGGTHAHTWMLQESVQSTPEAAPLVAQHDKSVKDWESGQTYRRQLENWEKEVAKAKAANRQPPSKPEKGTSPLRGRNYPGNMFNTTIMPIRQLAIRGILYYQGENEAYGGTHVYNRALFPKLIPDFRATFGDEKLPFGIVSLHATWLFEGDVAGFEDFKSWVSVRDAHMIGHIRNPGTGLITNHDHGGGLHPTPKEAIGVRSARWALNRVYGQGKTRYVAPVLDRMEKKDGRIIVHLKSDTKGEWSLTGLAPDADKEAGVGCPIRGFIIAGADRKFYTAHAKVVSRDSVEVWSDLVADPEAVRYAWHVWPNANLIANDHIPVHSFRTDDWAVDAESIGLLPRLLKEAQQRVKMLDERLNPPKKGK